ncbi:MAG: hypothetical protein M0P58_07395 [Bacteroidales bacterium]|nr:hypothetical protein [Bacteroidales bacterium]
MTDSEPVNLPVTKKHHLHWLKITLFTILILAVSSYIFIFFGFNYFGERFLRRYLQERIYTASHGLYQADFKKMHFNIITGKISIDSFQLVPDTLRYQQQKSHEKLTHSLYRVSFASMTIDRLHAWQIYTFKRINFRQLTIAKPIISIVGFPDTATANKSRWRILYEDIYPAIAKVFKDFHVDSVKLERGKFVTLFEQRTGKLSQGEYEFSAFLRDVSVNPFSYYNRERVFYSRDIDLVIYNFEYALADSLYLIRADEVGFSLARSRLYGKRLSLRPNFQVIRNNRVENGDFFELNLPSFSIDGINLYQALVDKQAKVKQLLLGNFSMKMFRNQHQAVNTVPVRKKKKVKITVTGLYTVISGALQNIAIDSIALTHASFEYYGSLNERHPEMTIKDVNLSLSYFYLDSVAWQNPRKILFANEIELDLKGFNLKLKDQVHTLSAHRVTFSTRQSMIRLTDGSLYPDVKKNELLAEGQKNTLYFQIPSMTFRNIDLKRFFNCRILNFDVLDIQEPDMKFTRFRPPKNKTPRFKKPKDFFEAENENVIYNLLKKYVQSIRGNEIRILRGYGQLTRQQDSIERKIAAASFDLTMEQFLIDSVHGLNQQGYFYSRDFDLDLHSVTIESPDSLRRLNIEHLHITTPDSLIEAEKIILIKLGPAPDKNGPTKNHLFLTVDFSLDKLSLTGLNHKKLFLEKILKANQIILENPILSLKTENQATPEIPIEESQLLPADSPIRNFEIGRLLVKKGTFSYNGEEDRKASYFTLKDIDFSVVNAMVRLPWEKSHDGLIRFDSLLLFVLPLRATLADSSYQLEINSLGVNSNPATIVAHGLRVIPLKPLNTLNDSGNRFTISVPELRLNGFYFDRAIFDNEWSFDRITLEEPSLLVEMKKPNTRAIAGQKKKQELTLVLPHFMKTLNIRSLDVNQATVKLDVWKDDSLRSYNLDNIHLAVSRFHYDSATCAHPEKSPLFNAEDITLMTPGFSGVTSDSMYTWKFSRFGFSTRAQTVYLDSVSLTPNFNRYDFSRKLGYQTDRFIVRIPRIDLEKLDFRDLITGQQLTTERIRLKGFSFEAYRDKRVPFPPWQRPPLPRQVFMKSPIPLKIDTLLVTDGFAAYEEQTGDEPGRIFFDHLNLALTGIAPQTSFVDAHGATTFMGEAPIEAWFHFLMDSPRDSMIIKATIGEMELKEVNPMLTRLVPASISGGDAKKTEIGPIWMNDSVATGNLVMYYNNLAIKLKPTENGTWPLIRTALLTELINLMIPENNPSDSGRLRTGLIYFERDRTKGFFNFVWKSVLSGIKSNVGFNSKIQKEQLMLEKMRKK